MLKAADAILKRKNNSNNCPFQELQLDGKVTVLTAEGAELNCVSANIDSTELTASCYSDEQHPLVSYRETKPNTILVQGSKMHALLTRTPYES